MTQQPTSGLTGLGKLVSVLLVLVLLGLGGWVVAKQMGLLGPKPAPNTNGNLTGSGNGGKVDNGSKPLDAAELVPAPTEGPRLESTPAAYVPKDNIIDIELSKYAGYSGLIVANAGLAPSDDSVFARKHGFKVRIKLSEEESWNALRAGKMAASATTTDVLAIYGPQMQVVVPAQIGYSRGADGVVTRTDIKRINDLKGKTLVSVKFTEADFFIRYLATEANIGINMMSDLKTRPDSDKINLVYTADGESAGAVFSKALAANSPALAGCVTWAPTTTDVVEQSGGKAQLLTTNRNLLIIADILIVNRGFAEKNPDKVKGLVDGLLAGNQMVRDNPDKHLDTIAKAFSTDKDKWDRAKAASELKKVHLANLPENMAFFTGGITAGGSFASIYQSAVLAYGTDLIKNPADPERFTDLAALKAAEASGAYKDQVAAIQPIATANGGRGAGLENDPLLSKDIKFFFEPNSDKLDMTQQANTTNLQNIHKLLEVSPGSKILLRGHVDDSNVPKFRAQGGDALVNKMALEAIDLSKRRANEVRQKLIEREKVDADRISTVGLGWSQPASKTNPDANRRVEAQWFTLE